MCPHCSSSRACSEGCSCGPTRSERRRHEHSPPLRWRVCGRRLRTPRIPPTLGLTRSGAEGNRTLDLLNAMRRWGCRYGARPFATVRNPVAAVAVRDGHEPSRTVRPAQNPRRQLPLTIRSAHRSARFVGARGRGWGQRLPDGRCDSLAIAARNLDFRHCTALCARQSGGGDTSRCRDAYCDRRRPRFASRVAGIGCEVPESVQEPPAD